MSLLQAGRMSVITNTVAKLATNVVNKEVDALQKQIEQLRTMNNQLQEAVSSIAGMLP
jgi:tetrahydromethanopterin S-methyltransferase subunit B